jgi:osmotically-inducible protein OsmY
MRLQRQVTAILAGAAMALLLGCARQEQETSAADREVVQKVRQALVADPALSTSAKNVTIDSKNEAVTLRGSVASEQERAAVAARAKQAAGDRAIENELVVASR